jgi:hypothetical protein
MPTVINPFLITFHPLSFSEILLNKEKNIFLLPAHYSNNRGFLQSPFYCSSADRRLLFPSTEIWA